MIQSPDDLYALNIGIGSLTAAALALLGMMFWNASLLNRDPFTARLLKLLAGAWIISAIGTVTALYRAARIDPEAVPDDGSWVGLAGRILQLTWYCYMIWFMLRPETKKNLNGAATGVL
jgi:hypothetical protein